MIQVTLICRSRQASATAYDGVGNITQTTLPTGAWLIYEYDAAQRLTAVADNIGNRIEYTLDVLGNRIQEDSKDPLGTLTRTMNRTYNSLNRLIEAIGGAGQTTRFGYDANGNQTHITVDPIGLAGGINPYSYAYQNPLKYVDRRG